jgi:hypothetical protein
MILNLIPDIYKGKGFQERKKKTKENSLSDYVVWAFRKFPVRIKELQQIACLSSSLYLHQESASFETSSQNIRSYRQRKALNSFFLTSYHFTKKLGVAPCCILVSVAFFYQLTFPPGAITFLGAGPKFLINFNLLQISLAQITYQASARNKSSMLIFISPRARQLLYWDNKSAQRKFSPPPPLLKRAGQHIFGIFVAP